MEKVSNNDKFIDAATLIQKYDGMDTVKIESTLLDIILVDEKGESLGRPYMTCAIDKNTQEILACAIK